MPPWSRCTHQAARFSFPHDFAQREQCHTRKPQWGRGGAPQSPAHPPAIPFPGDGCLEQSDGLLGPGRSCSDGVFYRNTLSLDETTQEGQSGGGLPRSN